MTTLRLQKMSAIQKHVFVLNELELINIKNYRDVSVLNYWF